MTSAARNFLPVTLLGALLLTLPLACAPATEPGPDAGEQVVADAGDTTPDAGAAECTDHCRADEDNEANCYCVWNDECGDGFACAETMAPDGGGTGLASCQCGPRGTAAYGEACEKSEECVSGLCTDNLCTQRCETATDCPAPFERCFSFLGACALNNP